MAESVSISINFGKIFRYGKVVVGICLVIAAVFGGRRLYYSYVLTKAADYVARGFPTVAAEYMQSSREYFSRDAASCKTLLTAFQNSQNVAQLRWAVESCALNGVSIAESLLAMAQLSAKDGDVARSGMFLKKAVERFKSAPGYIGLIGLAVHNKNREEAIRVSREALKAVPDSTELKLVVLRLFMDNGENALALVVARELQTIFATSTDVEYKNELSALITKLSQAENQAPPAHPK